MDGFEVFKSELQGQLGGVISANALASLELAACDAEGVILSTDDLRAAHMISSQYGADVKKVWERTVGPIRKVSVTGPGGLSQSDFLRPTTTDMEAHVLTAPLAQNIPAQPPMNIINDIPAEGDLPAGERPILRPGKTLDRYCVNETNRVARHAVMRLLDGNCVPVTYVYGSTGRGKTHLLNAVALEWLRRNPTGRLIYLHYDMLVADVSDACLTNGLKELKEHLQDTDILILDDVHLLRGRKRTQEELGCLIERLTQTGKIVLIAGATSPSHLADTGICARLAERLVGGLAVELKSPDYELRLRIANQWAEDIYGRGGPAVPQRQLDLIARRCDASVRELEGALVRLELEMEAAEGEIDDEDVRRLLAEVASMRAPTASMEAIFDFTAEVFGVGRAEMRSKARKQPIVRARQAFCLAVRKLTDTPLAAIGAMISRDHTTVMHSVEKAEIIAEQDQVFADRLSKILERFDTV